MRWTAEGTHQPTNIFEAACFRWAVKPVCKCGHSSTFDPHGLWWLFQRRHWDDRFGPAKARFWCRLCHARQKRKVRAISLDLAKPSPADFEFPMPDEREWKRAVSKFRA